MFFRNKKILLLYFVLFLFGCKKSKKATVINGAVVSNVEGVPLNNAEVKLYVKSLSSNAYTDVFKLKETILTTSDGRYEFSFLKTSSHVNYQINLSKSDYQSKSFLLNPDDINTGKQNLKHFSLLPVGKVEFNIKSNSSTGSTDEILFTFNNELDEKESFSNLLFVGNTIDTVLSTRIIAEKYNHFSYILKRNGQFITVLDSVFVSKGATLVREVIY